ncbi:exodeoxyribonuclease III [Fonsecaea erecta]|uniref:Exodeoxyribonuclease III n=1 Tax=Fonsecaea erecta TaxID=1367422 RepID=A0A178ZHD3_9EURO|nr:exodeoxyribonuclease III [Fonsecaea erecta]OAP59190.1 exodeoxyribonuclease III [Fonsecaea erecta]
MSVTAAKRSLSSSTGRSISPPALRRKVSHAAEDDTHVARTWLANPDHVRIFSWNVNGVGPLLQKPLSFDPGSLSPLRSFLKRHRWPQLLCLQEVKISAKDVATQRHLHQAANHGHAAGEPTYTVHFSLPRDKYNATGFGGKVHGVASFLRDDFASGVRITQRPGWDLEGRVLIHEHEVGLVIINGYWVNGTSNPYRDPATGQISGTRHDHKLRFHQHMLEEVLQHEAEGRHVILIGDMNIARSRIDGHPNLRTSPRQHVENRADFNAKFFDEANGMRGNDIFRHMHGNTKKFTYHPRGIAWGASCDRVDLIIVSHSLVDDLDAVTGTDILDSAPERGHSDHVPIWISVDIAKLARNLHDRPRAPEKG